MTVNAYVLITVEPAKTKGVRDRLQAISSVIVSEVLGPYDFVLEVEADTAEDLVGILRDQIRSLSGVTNTVTCIRI